MSMLPLLRYTLDLFAQNQPPERVQQAQAATDLVATPTPSTVLFRHPLAQREVRLGDALVAYEFQRARRRSIGFFVGPEGLVVRAPRWVSLREVDAALQEKSAWIVRKLHESREHQARRAAQQLTWGDGCSVPFLGEPLCLRLQPAPSACAAQLVEGTQGQHLQVHLPHHASAEQIRDAAQAWLMQQARTVFEARLNHFAAQLQVRWTQLKLSHAQTRWGSASASGAIRLNWRLVHFKLEVIDYVVAHELSHLRVMDHSPRFWATVRSVVPDYAVHRATLRQDAPPL